MSRTALLTALVTAICFAAISPVSTRAQYSMSLPGDMTASVWKLNQTLAPGDRWGHESETYVSLDNKEKYSRWLVLNRSWRTAREYVEVRIEGTETAYNAELSFLRATKSIRSTSGEKCDRYGGPCVVATDVLHDPSTKIIFTRNNLLVSVGSSTRAIAEQFAKIAVDAIDQIHRDALSAIAGEPASANLFKTISGNGQKWSVVEYSPPTPMDGKAKSSNFRLENGRLSATVLFREFSTADDAIDGSARKSATNASVEKYAKYGVDGERYYGYGSNGIVFRTGRFIVYVDCTDLASADQLAGYAFEAVKVLN